MRAKAVANLRIRGPQIAVLIWDVATLQPIQLQRVF